MLINAPLQFVVFGHYPTSMVLVEEEEEDDLRELLGRPRGSGRRRKPPHAYLCGHLHTMFK